MEWQLGPEVAQDPEDEINRINKEACCFLEVNAASPDHLPSTTTNFMKLRRVLRPVKQAGMSYPVVATWLVTHGFYLSLESIVYRLFNKYLGVFGPGRKKNIWLMLGMILYLVDAWDDSIFG